MHPTDHTSMDAAYSSEFNKSSSARYHRVTTYDVIIAPRSTMLRARPKSHMHKSQLALSKMLLGFKSLCNTLALCTYFNPRKI